jgi:hypothetical protein
MYPLKYTNMNKKLLLVLTSAVFTGYALNSHAQANQQLSNLTSPTAINVELLPNSNNSRNLGSSTFGWKSLYLTGRFYINGTLTMHAPGAYNFFIGPGAGNTAVTDSFNTATGANALHSVTNGRHNTANGVGSLFSNTTGASNTAIGYNALYNNTTGINNIANGVKALSSNTTGRDNTANGYASLFSNTIGWRNTANGYYALSHNTTGSYNTANGFEALYSSIAGENNTANGATALLNNTTGSYNSAYGYGAGHTITTGSNNTFIGNEADAASGALNNVTALGNGASVSASNTVRIGNNGVTSIGGYVGWSNISDGRVKKNIKKNVPGLAFINKLNPVTYNLDLDAADKIVQFSALKPKDDRTIASEAEDTAVRKAKEHVVYTGFVAQEVEKAAKELNYDFSGVDAAKNDKDLYGLRYAEFVVPLVKAVQELSKQNEELSKLTQELLKKNDEKDIKITNLQKQMDELKGVKTAGIPGAAAQQSATTKLLLTSASLGQNNPNPFVGATTIHYSLPAGFRVAQMVITDNSGKAIRQVQLNTAGNGTVNIDASTLGSGTYNYSLIVDGRVMERKKMIVAH